MITTNYALSRPKLYAQNNQKNLTQRKSNVSFGESTAGNNIAAVIAMVGALTVGYYISKPPKLAQTVAKEVTLSQKALHVLDSLKIKTSEALKDTTLTKFANDTVEISEDLAKKPQEFMDELSKKSLKKLPRDKIGTDINIVGDITVATPVYGDSKVYSNSVKPVIKDGFFKDKSGDVYVPVEYYGKYIPEYKK